MRKILLCLVVAALAGSVYAKDGNEATEDKSLSSKSVMTNSFFSNWFLSFGGGAQVYLGDDDNAGLFEKRIAPTVNLAFGKWFTPGLGLRIQADGGMIRGYSYAKATYQTGIRGKDGLYKQEWSTLNLHGDVLFNLTNLFCGYKEKRVYSAIPYVGYGWLHSFDWAEKQYMAANFGFINKFRLSKAWDLNLEGKVMLANDDFDGQIGGKRADLLPSLAVSFTYKFGNRGFRKTPRVVYAPVEQQLITQEELDALKNKLDVYSTDNANLQAELAAMKPEVVEKKVTVSESSVAPNAIFFGLNSFTLNDQQIINLGFLADQMKEYPDKLFNLSGYADRKTGTMEGNRKISLKRAQAVADALIDVYGIDKARLKVVAEGATQKYEKDYLNRMVIVEEIK